MEPTKALKAYIREHYPKPAPHRAFADAVGIAPNSLSRYLNKERAPARDVRLRIVELTGIDLDPAPTQGAPS